MQSVLWDGRVMQTICAKKCHTWLVIFHWTSHILRKEHHLPPSNRWSTPHRGNLITLWVLLFKSVRIVNGIYERTHFACEQWFIWLHCTNLICMYYYRHAVLTAGTAVQTIWNNSKVCSIYSLWRSAVPPCRAAWLHDCTYPWLHWGLFVLFADISCLPLCAPFFIYLCRIVCSELRELF